jgi:hypothetical protein
LGFDGEVQGGLSAHGGENCIDLSIFENASKGFNIEGKEVYVIGGYRIGHDGSWIGIDKGYFNSFFFKGASGLRAGIIEFAGLSDDDGTGTNDEDRFDREIFWHEKKSFAKIVRKSGSGRGEFG